MTLYLLIFTRPNGDGTVRVVDTLVYRTEAEREEYAAQCEHWENHMHRSITVLR